MSENNRKGLITSALLVAGITFLIYSPALFFGFVNFDDPQYVYDNPGIRVLDFTFLKEVFTTSYMGWWMPLVWISFAIDYLLWGLNPIGYHLANNLLHAINAGLVVVVADRLLSSRMGRGRYYQASLIFIALLWSIHPLRVESVAWVTERKDVLNGLFSLMSLLGFVSFARRSEGSKVSGKRGGAYLFCSVCFVLAVMTKPLSVVLPVMFLVLDWYPLRRFESVGVRALILEKLPFLLISVILVAVTLTFASGETILVSLQDHPLQNRLLVAGYAMGEYLRLTIWPSGLVHFYPIRPELPISYYLNSVLFLAVSLFALLNMKKYPIVLSSLALFILPLVPVLGFFQNGDQSHANRFTYLSSVFPSIALGALLLACLARTTESKRYVHNLVPAVLLVMLAINTLLTCKLIYVWRNSETLWSRQIDVLPVGRAYFYRGEYFLRSGEYGRAADDLAVAVRMARDAGNPELFNLHALRGDALYRGGRFSEAVDEFSAAISIRPYANYFYHRSLALERMGRHAEARADSLAAGNDRSPITWRTGTGADDR